MNREFTENLGRWLDEPQDRRNYRQGALMLFQLNGNAILYRNLSAAPERHRDVIEYELRKYYNVRVKNFTHEQVNRMQRQVDAMPALNPPSKATSLRSGKRPDHDRLPAEIQALYVENLGLLQRMRDVHSRLRLLSEEHNGELCPDSDRYPYLEELIRLDKRRLENWHRYDTFDPASGRSTMALDSRDERLKLIRLCVMNAGNYRKRPSEELGNRIKEWYGRIAQPPASLTRNLQELELI